MILILLFLHYAITAITFVIFVACIISFLPINPYNKFVQILRRLTEPMFNFVRRFMPTNVGMFDLAPLVILIVLMLIDNLIIRLIYASAG